MNGNAVFETFFFIRRLYAFTVGSLVQLGFSLPCNKFTIERTDISGYGGHRHRVQQEKTQKRPDSQDLNELQFNHITLCK